MPLKLPRLGDTLLLFLLCAATYLICAKGRPWIEAEYQVARSQHLVKAGRLSSDRPIAEFDLLAPDGRYYEVHGLLNVALHIPIVALEPLLSKFAGERTELAVYFLAALTGVFVNSLSVVVFYTLLLKLKISRPASLICACCFAFGSLLFPYSGNNYEGNIDLLFLLLATYQFFSYLAGSSGRGLRDRAEYKLLLTGVFSGVALHGREFNFLLVGLIGLGLTLELLKTRKIKPLLFFVLGTLPFLALLCWHNYVRTGTPFQTAISYRIQNGQYPIFEITSPYGILCLLLSPGGSMFAYSPVLLLALLGLVQFWKQRPIEALFSWVFTAAVVVCAGLLYKWFGHNGWGPRYTIPTLPFLLISLAFWLDTPNAKRFSSKLLLVSVFGWALLIQLSAVLVNWHARLAYLLRRADLSEHYMWSDLMFTIHSSQWWDALKSLYGNLRYMRTRDPAWEALMNLPSNMSAASQYTALTLDTWWNRLLYEGTSPWIICPYLLLSLGIVSWCLVILFQRNRW